MNWLKHLFKKSCNCGCEDNYIKNMSYDINNPLVITLCEIGRSGITEDLHFSLLHNKEQIWVTSIDKKHSS